MFPHVVTFLLILLPSGPPASAHASASGDLTVTAVVASSASLTFDSDGKPVVVVANAPADANAIELTSTQFAQKRNPDQKPREASPHRSQSKNKGAKHASAR